MAAVIERDVKGSRSSFAKIVNDERNRSIFYQILVFGMIGWACWYLFTNTTANLEARGMSSGFEFWEFDGGLQHRLVGYPLRAPLTPTATFILSVSSTP